MYTPRGVKTNENQIGGQTPTYIDMESLKASVSTMVIPSLSSVQYIMSTAQLTSMEAISSITTEQLSSLIAMVDSQIASDYSSISVIESTIRSTQTEIDRPNGLSDQYTSAREAYSTALQLYTTQSTIAARDMSKYIIDVSTLSTLYIQSTLYASTLKSYQNEYRAVLSSLQENASTVQMYERQYRGVLSSISSNNILYIQASSSLSTISSIVYSDLVALNNPTNIAIRPQLSTTYITDLFTYNEVSTTVNKYIISDLTLKSNVSTIYSYLYSTLQISSFDLLSSDSYYSTIQYYSSLEQITVSTINYYNRQVSSLMSDIRYLSTQQLADYASLESQIVEIETQQATYYNYLKQALQAECDEYVYGIQQYNSQVGYIIASLGIIVNNIASLNDTISIQSLDPNISPSAQTFNQTQRQRYTRDTSNIMSIINTLNILDLKFGNIITYIGSERRYKEEFIDKRQSILTTYEIPALRIMKQAELDAIRANYIAEFKNLNDIVVNINNQILGRSTLLSEINNAISPFKSSINQYFTTYLTISADQLPDVLTQVLDDTPPLPNPPTLPPPLGGIAIPLEPIDPSSNSMYAFIPPINFNPGF
jgi:hypothetical protein